MKSMLFRTGSGTIPVQVPRQTHTSRRLSAASVSLHGEASRRSLRRSASEPNIIRPETKTPSKTRSRSFSTARIPEVEFEDDDCSGGGMNKNRKSGGGGNGGAAEPNNIGAYYIEMIKSDPNNSLLLRNYGKYLHEVERDLVKAEEYYGRAILASPGDGELLSLYGKLIWESERNVGRAEYYFTQALQFSPNDCTILGSYAHFLWEAEEEDDEEMENEVLVMVEAF